MGSQLPDQIRTANSLVPRRDRALPPVLRGRHMAVGLALATIPALFATGCRRAPTADLVVSAAQSTPSAMVEAATPTSTAMPSAPESPSLMATPTTFPPPSPTPLPTATTRATPTPTVKPTVAPTATPSWLVETVDRTCPVPPPAKPEYQRYWLAAEPWPTPRPDLETHLWLTHPLPRGDRLLTSEILPYGSDGQGRYLLHNGVDIAEPEGVPVLAVADGVVVFAGSDADRLFGWRCNWYGQLVVLLLDDSWEQQDVYVLYGHVLNVKVAAGQRVSRFDQVAEIGHGGVALVPHLHLEVRVGDNAFDASRNPLLWIAPGSSRGVVAGRLIDPEDRPWQGYPVELVGPGSDPDRQTAWTYVGDPDSLIQPDERFGENFVLSDLKPGAYEAVASVQGKVYRASVNVTAGGVSEVEIVTEAYRPPTPSPEATAETQP